MRQGWFGTALVSVMNEVSEPEWGNVKWFKNVDQQLLLDEGPVVWRYFYQYKIMSKSKSFIILLIVCIVGKFDCFENMFSRLQIKCNFILHAI